MTTTDCPNCGCDCERCGMLQVPQAEVLVVQARIAELERDLGLMRENWIESENTAAAYAEVVNLVWSANMLMNPSLWRDMIRERARVALNIPKP